MAVVARCSHCPWSYECEADIDALVVAAAALDEHLVSVHNYSFGVATRTSQAWLAQVGQQYVPPPDKKRGRG